MRAAAVFASIMTTTMLSSPGSNGKRVKAHRAGPDRASVHLRTLTAGPSRSALLFIGPDGAVTRETVGVLANIGQNLSVFGQFHVKEMPSCSKITLELAFPGCHTSVIQV